MTHEPNAPDEGTDDRRALRLPVRHGYGLVLGLIVLTYLLALQATRPWTVTLLLLAQSATAWQALRTSRARPGYRLAAAVVFLLALVTAAAFLLTEDIRLGGLTFLTASLLYLVTPMAVVRDIGFHRSVDRDTMLGALAAYLLIGMASASPTSASPRCSRARSSPPATPTSRRRCSSASSP
jgi:hypothetical protein